MNYHQWVFLGNKDQKRGWVKYGKFVHRKENRYSSGCSKLSFRKEIGAGKECIFYALWVSKYFTYARRQNNLFVYNAAHSGRL